jgi:hypothetical protein
MKPKELFMSLLSLTLAGISTLFGNAKSFITLHAFWFHFAMGVGQWLCYIGSFAVAALTIYKHFKDKPKDGLK